MQMIVVDIDAEAMADGTTLSLFGEAGMDVDNANGSISIMADGEEDAGPLFGTLTIVADDDDEDGVGDTLEVNTGTNNTYIDAADADDIVVIDAEVMADDTTLTLIGAADMNVDNANGSITIEGNDDTLGSLTGELIIVADDDGEDGAGDTLVVNTGTSDIQTMQKMQMKL